MNKYVVAYLSMFDNVLTQTLVEAASEYDAALQYLERFQDVEFEEEPKLSDLEVLQEIVFSMDANISVYKIAE